MLCWTIPEEFVTSNQMDQEISPNKNVISDHMRKPQEWSANRKASSNRRNASSNRKPTAK